MEREACSKVSRIPRAGVLTQAVAGNGFCSCSGDGPGGNREAEAFRSRRYEPHSVYRGGGGAVCRGERQGGARPENKDGRPQTVFRPRGGLRRAKHETQIESRLCSIWPASQEIGLGVACIPWPARRRRAAGASDPAPNSGTVPCRGSTLSAAGPYPRSEGNEGIWAAWHSPRVLLLLG